MTDGHTVQDLERFDPDAAGDNLVAAEHMARYRAAVPLAEGRRVLDAGCGTGYGLALLAAGGARTAVGVDVDQAAVKQASGHAPGAEVVVGAIHELPFDDDSFDLVVCFEVIEHVEEQDAALRELRRVLGPDGLLVLSSPNRDVYPPGNPNHVHEYVPEELEAALRSMFDTVALYRQHVWLASAVLSEVTAEEGGGRLPVQLAAPLRRAEETYTVAVAGSGDIPSLGENLALAQSFELRWWQEQVENFRRELDRAIAHGQEMQREIDVAWTAATQRRAQAAELGARLLDLERESAELLELRRRFHEVRHERDLLTQELAGRRAEIERNRQVMTDLQTSVSWRVTRPLRLLKSLRGR